MSFIMKYKEASLADDMAEERRSNAWSSLLVVHASYPAEDDFFEHLRTHEDTYMEEMYKYTPEAKKKDGSWKYRKFNFEGSDGSKQTGGLPMAYLSAKSTIMSAFINGVSVVDDTGDEWLSKDQLTKAIKAKKDVNLTPLQKSVNYVDWIKQLWGCLTVEEQTHVMESMPSIGA